MRSKWLVIYDIADPRRLRRIERLCTNNGVRLQESVFLCELDATSLRRFQEQLAVHIEAVEDSVRFYAICERDWHTRHEDGISTGMTETGAWIV